MRQLSSSTSHINNRFGPHNVGVMMGMSGVQYSGSCGVKLFGTSSTHATWVDNSTAVELLVAHTNLCYSAENQNARLTKR